MQLSKKEWELNEIKCWLKYFLLPNSLTGVSVGNQKRVSRQAHLSRLTKPAGWLVALGCLQCQNLLPCELSKFSEVMSITCYPVKLTEFPWLCRTLLYLSLQYCISTNELWLLSGLWGQIKILPSVLVETQIQMYVTLNPFSHPCLVATITLDGLPTCRWPDHPVGTC